MSTNYIYIQVHHIFVLYCTILNTEFELKIWRLGIRMHCCLRRAKDLLHERRYAITV